MLLREAKRSDIPAIGTVQAEANRTDSILRWMTQDIDKYPLEYWLSSTRFAKRRMSQSGSVSFVVETEASDYPHENSFSGPEVVGFAIWNRMGTSPQAQEWHRRYNSSWTAALDRALYGLEDRYRARFPFRITNPVNRAKFLEFLRSRGSFDPEVLAEAWELDVFDVHPDWQRRGLGRMMMQWGFDRAREEKVPIVIKGSSIGGLAYRSMGFKVIGELGFKDLSNTLGFGGVEPSAYIWEPEGCEGMWFERAKETWKTQEEKHLGEKEAEQS